MKTYHDFSDRWLANAQLVLDAIAMKPARGIPTWLLNDMQWPHIEELSGNPPGSYPKDPVRVYREFQLKTGVCFIDQWMATNPLSMKDRGYEDDKPRGATTGASSSITPGVPTENIRALIEGLRYSRERGRQG